MVVCGLILHADSTTTSFVQYIRNSAASLAFHRNWSMDQAHWAVIWRSSKICFMFPSVVVTSGIYVALGSVPTGKFVLFEGIPCDVWFLVGWLTA